jgi:phage virion morphogenesis protein
MSALLSVTVSGNAAQELARLPGALKGASKAVGVYVRRSTLERFRFARDPDGTPWVPLNPFYAAIKRGSGILRGSGMSGGLMGSITMNASEGAVEVGTNKIYAGVHQFGAVIKPRRAKALAFRMGGNNSPLAFARSVTIPARPFLGISAEDETEIGLILFDVLQARRGR